MKETLLALINLAEIDKTIDQIIEDKETIPQTIQDNQTEIAKLQESIQTITNELQEAQTSESQINDIIAEKSQWIIDREARINEIKTTKEYQAALKEISTAKKEIKDKEDELKIVQPNIQALTEQLENLSNENNPKIQELNDQISQYKEKFEKIQTVLDQENQKRQTALTEFADKQVLKHYEHIHNRIMPALSKIDHGICEECGTRVLPQILNQVNAGQAIQYCNRCKRILYLEELLMDS